MKKIWYTFIPLMLLVSCKGGLSENPKPSPSEEPQPTEQDSADPSEDQIIQEGDFTILAWSDIVDPSAAQWKYEKLLEAGFDTYLGWYDSFDKVEKSLEAADKTGLKLIINHTDIYSNLEKEVNSMKSHPSLAGYHIKDEPEVTDFPDLAEKIASIQRYDAEHPCYVNLYPNWAWGGEVVYRSKVDLFLKKVPVKFLSFDNYPIKTIGGEAQLRPDWYHNLEDISAAAKDAGIPFWGFALALAHNTKEAYYRVPTLGDLRLQQFSNMVYGAVGFQYFTTWGLIQDGGVVEPVYGRIKTVNSELRSLSRLFCGATIKNIWHTGATIPHGTKKLDTLPEGIKTLKTEETGAVVSFFTKGNRQYIAVVNKNMDGGMDLEICFADGVEAKAVGKDLSETPFSPGKIRLPAGDIAIYSWK